MSELLAFGVGPALGALLFGYLLGSIPFGLILTRLAGTQDLRSIGSKSIGATNVLRTGRKDLAIATLLLDALKGSVAVWIATRWGYQAATLAGLGAFLGHIYPVWLKFAGGKGVATYVGVLLAQSWHVVLLFAAVWLAVAFWKRYSSLASLSASAAIAALMAIVSLPLGSLTLSTGTVIAMTLLLWWKHRENIARLRAGTESKIGQKG